MEKCLFTDDPIQSSPVYTPTGQQTLDINCHCPTCGIYTVSTGLIGLFKSRGNTISQQSKVNCAFQNLSISAEDPNQIPFWVVKGEVSGRQQIHTNSPRLSYFEFEDFESEFIDHSLKPFRLLETIANKLRFKGAFAFCEITKKDMILIKIPTEEEMRHHITFLAEKGFLLSNGHYPVASGGTRQIFDPKKIGLTIEGWETVRKRNVDLDTNKVFIAMKFKWPSGDEANRIKVVEAIKNACARNGYEGNFVTDNHTGYITDQIISDIKNANFVVAELSYNNRGVYFESGYARGLGKEVFHVIQDSHIEGEDSEGKEIHFDIKQINHRTWSTPKELEQKLGDWIEAKMGRYEND